MESFAVLWSDSERAVQVGRLVLSAAALQFEGPQTHSVPYAHIESVHVARDRNTRVGGRPALVLGLTVGGPVRIASFGGVGILSELAERLGRLTAHPASA
jgi:hypothetical protein